MDIGLFEKYGLVGLLSGGIITLLFFIVKWVLSTTKEILKQAAEERKCWHQAISEVSKAMDKHTEQAAAFHDLVNEAHRYQREEHKEMIVTLGRINGYKHD